MTMITPSSELTLTKGTSPAGLNEFALRHELTTAMHHLSICLPKKNFLSLGSSDDVKPW